MKSLFLGVAILALAGCAASRQEVVEQLGQQYIGQNVDQMVVSLGPPASTFRMNSGEMSYIWQLTSETNFAAESDRYGIAGRAKTNFCKVSVITTPAGIVTQLRTEDASGTGGIIGALGVDIRGSVCARHLGLMPRRS